MGLIGSEIAVPGSISNLGPAFDACAVAVRLYLRVRIVEILDAGSFETVFIGGRPPAEDRIAAAFAATAARRGPAPHGLRVEVRTDIPMRAGLGSSGAATIAGIRLFEALTSPAPADRSLALASELEGHPDNAAACLLGGLTISCVRDDRLVTARTARWPAGIRFVVATPDFRLDTAVSRHVLPSSLPFADAVFNLQRALLLVRALDTGRHEDLREAMRDRWHQPARAPLVPGLAEALALDDPAVLGVCLSGSGPSVVALAEAAEAPRAEALLGGIYRGLGLTCTMRTLEAHQPHGE
jgi:homoserine kinase